MEIESFLDYSYVEWQTYSDLEKAFSVSGGFGKIFSAKAERNSKKIKVKGRLLAQIVSNNFTVYMDEPTEDKGFFIDPLFNKPNKETFHDQQPVYIKSMTYGKVAFIAIESEYSYNEIKEALSSSFIYKVLGLGGGYEEKSIDIFNKSKITAFVISDKATQTQFFDDLESLKSVFNINYGKANYGFPIYCQGRYVYDGKAFQKVPDARRRIVERRPSTSRISESSTERRIGERSRSTSRRVKGSRKAVDN